MNDPAFIRERFKELKKQRRFPSGRFLSDTMQIPINIMVKIMRGNVRSESDNQVFKRILEHIAMTEDEFFKRAHANVRPPLVAPSKPQQETQKVPLYGEIPAGHPSFNEGAPEPDEWIDPPPTVKGRRIFALRVFGTSMAPYLLPGDIVFLEPLEIHIGPKDPKRPAPRFLFERLHHRMIAALLDGDSTLKVLRFTPTQGEDYDLHLVPHNSEFPTCYVKPTSEFRIQGVVVATLRDETLSPWTLFQGGTHAAAPNPLK